MNQMVGQTQQIMNQAGVNQQQRQAMNFPAGNQAAQQTFRMQGMQAAGIQGPQGLQSAGNPQAMNSLSGQNEHQLRQLLMTQQPNRSYPNQFQ